MHGAFADASTWNGVIDRLQRDGYPVIAPANPLLTRPSVNGGTEITASHLGLTSHSGSVAEVIERAAR